ncbi:MAG: hypothetical protein LKE46_02020 [Clostridium sp.]|uniref:hypothetical protein n=1 Tax=Clostridium sp. TaxID=1506 RepID=UPI0025C06F36|nr:hypothetical protein [Clostridium sp.]MCH3963027.1 hypothetical protein [Clostridium sp.]MCI1871404.1 hypothetical protein [Clostridium sp.]MCI2202943.1 hypothetical protein [Clostridium sp.]
MYESINHLELSTDELSKKKDSWENFVSEAKKEHPKVLALVTAYGTQESIVGMKIVFQWVDGKIEFERKYQLLDAPMDILLDKMIDEVVWIGKNIKLHLINKAVPIEYCPNCGEGVMSRILDKNMAIKETAPDWETESLCTIYINPQNPSLAYTIFYKGTVLYKAGIHKCGNNLQFMDNKHEELYPLFKYKIRTQVVRLLVDKLHDWNIQRAIVGTGNPDDPNIISILHLPNIWEGRKTNKHKVNKND